MASLAPVVAPARSRRSRRRTRTGLQGVLWVMLFSLTRIRYSNFVMFLAYALFGLVSSLYLL